MWFSQAVVLALLFEKVVSAPATGRSLSNEFDEFKSSKRVSTKISLPDASVSADIVARDVASIAGVGAGGLEWLPFYLYGLAGGTYGTPTPTDWNTYGFGTPAFNSLFKTALQAAQKADILIDFALGPNQGAGVPAIPGTPGLSYELLIGNVSIEGGSVFDGPVPQPQQPSQSILSGLGFQHPLELFGSYNLTAVTAFKVISKISENVSIPLQASSVTVPTVHLDEASYVDLTPFVCDGYLNWTVPSIDSTWRIFSFWGHYTNQRSNTGGLHANTVLGNGSWTVDHFSKAGAQVTTDFWDQYILNDIEIERLLKAVGNYGWEDSMEIVASLYWTPDLLERFQQNRGYSLVKYLPLLFSTLNSWNGLLTPYPEQFHYGIYTVDGTSVHDLDYRTTLNEGYRDYVTHYHEWLISKAKGLSNQPAYNLPLTMLDDIPLIDGPECESLGWADIVDAYRQFSGPGHLSGKKIISNEMGAVHTAAYSLTVPELLYHVKRAAAGGITMNVFHGSPYSGNYPNTTWPGYTTFGYTYTDMWNSIQPCWQHMKDMMDYVGRNQWSLQQGTAKVDLAFYLYENPYETVQEYPSSNLVDRGYTYDYLGSDNLLSPQATVLNGVLAPFGPSYKAIIFASDAFVTAAQQNLITVSALQAVIGFAKSGLPIVFVGNPPNQTLPAVSQEEARLELSIQQLMSTENMYFIPSIDNLPSLLLQIGVEPRNSLTCSRGPVYSVWRSDNKTETDYVFFYNDNNVSTSCTAQLATNARARPYLFDSWTGSQQPLLQYNQSITSVSVPIHLRANQTTLIVLKSLSKSNISYPCSISQIDDDVLSLKYINGRSYAALLGPATIKSSANRTWNFTETPPPATSITTWDIHIEDWHAPLDRFNVTTEITYHDFTSRLLVPWSHLTNNSNTWGGVGRYVSTFYVPNTSLLSGNIGAVLHLGPVVHTIRVYLNGSRITPIDTADPTVDITEYIEAGKTYELVIEVTTPLFNRIKSTANSTMIWGNVAGLAQHLYSTLPYQEYGLLGPVSLQWTYVYELSENIC